MLKIKNVMFFLFWFFLSYILGLLCLYWIGWESNLGDREHICAIYVTLDHKTSHKGQGSTSSES